MREKLDMTYAIVDRDTRMAVESIPDYVEACIRARELEHQDRPHRYDVVTALNKPHG